MNLKKEIEVLCGSLTLIIAFSGFYNIVRELFVSVLPFSVIFALILVAAVYALRIPPPSEEAVEAILGKELHLEDNSLKTVAHRGAGLDAPENSLTAFKFCKEKGCNSIEFDIQLTQDGVPIVFHDDTLERLTEINNKISEMKWEDLSKVDISVKHSLKDKFSKVYIPTLDETVTQLLSSEQTMIIDIKNNSTKMVSVILNLFDKYPELHSRAIVSSFFPNLIYLIRRSNPKIVCSVAHRPHAFAYESYKYPEGKGPKKSNIWYKHYVLAFCDLVNGWALPRITYYLLGLSAILLHKDIISPKSIIDWRSKGVRVMAWTVNSPTEKVHLNRNLKITYLTDTLVGENSVHLNQSF